MQNPGRLSRIRHPIVGQDVTGGIAKQLFRVAQKLLGFAAAGVTRGLRILSLELSAAMLTDHLSTKVFDANLKPSATRRALLHEIDRVGHGGPPVKPTPTDSALS